MKKVQLANEFSKVLNSWLTKKELKEINRINKTAGYADGLYCATHEFCDPNQAMIDAYEKLFGRISFSQTATHLINQAWTIAKKNNFQI